MVRSGNLGVGNALPAPSCLEKVLNLRRFYSPGGAGFRQRGFPPNKKTTRQGKPQDRTFRSLLPPHSTQKLDAEGRAFERGRGRGG
jgi:hypothetical protein